MKKLTFLFIFFLLTGLVKGNAQTLSPTVISSGGDFFENSNVSISWTLGETVTETFSNSSIILTQGFHQPLTEAVSNGLWNSASLDMDIDVYPNPSKNKLHIYMSRLEFDSYTLELYDMNGQKYLTKNVSEKNYILNMESFAAGSYLIRIVTPEGFQTFKIIKQ